MGTELPRRPANGDAIVLKWVFGEFGENVHVVPCEESEVEFAFERSGIEGGGTRWSGVFFSGGHKPLNGEGLEVGEEEYKWQQGAQALGWIE